MKDKGGENKYKKNKKNKGAKKNDKKYKEVDKPIYIPWMSRTEDTHLCFLLHRALILWHFFIILSREKYK